VLLSVNACIPKKRRNPAPTNSLGLVNKILRVVRDKSGRMWDAHSVYWRRLAVFLLGGLTVALATHAVVAAEAKRVLVIHLFGVASGNWVRVCPVYLFSYSGRSNHEGCLFEFAGHTQIGRAGMNNEQQQLEAAQNPDAPWKKWGPYLSERQWRTVREDYSEDGNAWDYFGHDRAPTSGQPASAAWSQKRSGPISR
jgi:hypothetical protein